jgi:hypothetical protein
MCERKNLKVAIVKAGGDLEQWIHLQTCLRNTYTAFCDEPHICRNSNQNYLKMIFPSLFSVCLHNFQVFNTSSSTALHN